MSAACLQSFFGLYFKLGMTARLKIFILKVCTLCHPHGRCADRATVHGSCSFTFAIQIRRIAGSLVKAYSVLGCIAATSYYGSNPGCNHGTCVLEQDTLL